MPAAAFPESEIMIEKYLEGETHWTSVAYARMEKLQDKIRILGIEIPVVDVSRSKTMKDVALWLKDHIEK